MVGLEVIRGQCGAWLAEAVHSKTWLGAGTSLISSKQR